MKSSEVDKPTTFSERVYDSLNAPVRLRQMLIAKWEDVFNKRPFPDDQKNLNVFLAIEYKVAKLQMDKEGKEATERFCENYNRALSFRGIVDKSLYKCLSIKFSKTEGDVKMATSKKGKLQPKKTARAQARKEKKEPKEKTYDTESMRYLAMRGFADGWSQERIANEITRRTGKEKPATYYTSFRNFYNSGGGEHLGFPAPKVPIGPDGKPGTGGRADSGGQKASQKASKGAKVTPKLQPKKKAMLKIKT